MPSPPSTSGIRDNNYCGSVGDFLKPHIRDGSQMSVVSAYFTIYAYAALKDWLDRIGHMDFLFGEPSFVKSLDPAKTETKAFIIAPEGLKLANTLQQKRVARECADWIHQKVDIKTVCQTGFLHGKLYHIANDGQDAVAILGSSNFTPRGLGLQDTGSNIELNLIASDPADRDQLKAWFDRLWTDPNLVKDVKAEVLQYLAQVYQNHPPEFIYYKTLFHIFEKFLGDARKTDADLGATTLFDTEIWKALFDFQKDGVKGMINNTLKDLGNQIAFVSANNDEAFREAVGVASVKETLRQAQAHFTNWAKQPPAKRKTSDLLLRLGSDFFKLLDELTIARARKHVQKYYAHEMERLGGFPKRLKPVSIYPEIDSQRRFLSYDKLNEEMVGSQALPVQPVQIRQRRVQAHLPDADPRPVHPGRPRNLPHRHDEGRVPQAPRKLRAVL